MTTLPTPPEVEALQKRENALGAYLRLSYTDPIADAALAARTRQAEEERAAREKAETQLETLTMLRRQPHINTTRRAEEAEARCREMEQWVDDLQSGMYINCVYCGHRYGPDDDVGGQTMREALEAHIAVCPKHPLTLAKAENAAMRARASQLQHDAAECMEAARGANEALGEVQADNERLRGEVERLTAMLADAASFVNVHRLRDDYPSDLEKTAEVLKKLEARQRAKTKENVTSYAGGG